MPTRSLGAGACGLRIVAGGGEFAPIGEGDQRRKIDSLVAEPGDKILKPRAAFCKRLFAQIVIAIGEPVYVPRVTDPAALEKLQVAMGQRLHELFGSARAALKSG